jgi:hypothetical protein
MEAAQLLHEQANPVTEGRWSPMHQGNFMFWDHQARNRKRSLNWLSHLAQFELIMVPPQLLHLAVEVR